MKKNKVIILDIDGVILDTEVIFREMLELKIESTHKWGYFHAHCNEDRVNTLQETLSFIQCLNPSVRIVLSTARNECCRKETEEKLTKIGFKYDLLLMRGKNDERSSAELKKDHINLIKETMDIIAFVDDDLSNCQMAKELGLLALRKV